MARGRFPSWRPAVLNGLGQQPASAAHRLRAIEARQAAAAAAERERQMPAEVAVPARARVVAEAQVTKAPQPVVPPEMVAEVEEALARPNRQPRAKWRREDPPAPASDGPDDSEPRLDVFARPT